MKLVSVVNSKGGVGKSMVSRMLGCGLMNMGLRVAIMDADGQATCLDWSMKAINQGLADFTPVVTRVTGLRNRHDAMTMFSAMDVVIVDTIGTTEGESVKTVGRAISDADLVLIPLNPASSDEVKAVAKIESMMETATSIDPNKLVRYIFTRMNSRKTNFEKNHAVKFASEAASRGYMTLLSIMYMRDQYALAIEHGTSPLSLGEKEPARKEVEELAQEVAELLGIVSAQKEVANG